MSELNKLIEMLKSGVNIFIVDAYESGKREVLTLLESELNNPTCLTCKFCDYVEDDEYRKLPYLQDCLKIENKDNKEFMELFDSAMSNFEEEAPKICKSHKFTFENFKLLVEMIEGE